MGGVKGNNVVDFKPKSEVPTDCIVTYAKFVCDHRPLKGEPYQIRLTVGRDKLQSTIEVGSLAILLLESKLLLHSTISDAYKGARFLTLDIKGFFLQTYMKRTEYMCIHSKHFLKDIREKYDIDNIVADVGYIYCKIKKRYQKSSTCSGYILILR